MESGTIFFNHKAHEGCKQGTAKVWFFLPQKFQGNSNQCSFPRRIDDTPRKKR